MAVLKIRDATGAWVRVPSLCFTESVHLDDVLTDSGKQLSTIIREIQNDVSGKMDSSVYAPNGIITVSETSKSSDNGITVCSHTKSGTVHTLTAERFTDTLFFVASDGFKQGDTFQIGGRVFSPVKESGQELEDNAFLSGQMVHCICADGKLWLMIGVKNETGGEVEPAGTLVASMATSHASGGYADFSVKDGGTSLTAYVQSYDDYDSDSGHSYIESRVIITIDGAELGDAVSFDYTMSAIKWVSVSISGTDTLLAAALEGAYSGTASDKTIKITLTSGMTDSRIGLTLNNFKIGAKEVRFAEVAE